MEDNKSKKWIIILSLILAGEIIFGLPFHIARFFRPTVLEVFNLSNAQWGDAVAFYGVFALLSYFPSGVIADRFSARKLMSFSLLCTALGGIWLTTIPGQTGLSFLFGFWGITTILLFWSAMLRATREWGGKLSQGKAFGLLDGGRGLAAAGAASIAVFFLSTLLPGDLENITPSQRTHALVTIIWFYTLLTLAAALLIWFTIPETKTERSESSPLKGIKQVLSRRTTWLQAFIVICAYCGYKALDFYAQYGMLVLDMNEVEASRFVANASYLRAVGAIAAGFMADRLSTQRVLLSTFLILIVSYLVLISVNSSPDGVVIVIINLLISFLAVYALRGVYFALFEETKVPDHLTGTTAGIVSLIGFTPDIFFYPIAGRIIDNAPGIEGYHQFFWMLNGFAIVGLLATLLLSRKSRRL